MIPLHQQMPPAPQHPALAFAREAVRIATPLFLAAQTGAAIHLAANALPQIIACVAG